MKQLLNTLYVTSEDAYLALDGENVTVNRNGQVAARYPLHTLSGIISFAYAGASPALMGACNKHGVSLAFCTPRGKFLASIAGETSGNVLLRRTQYRIADDDLQSCLIAKNMILGKVYNCRWALERVLRDHGMRVDEKKLKEASLSLKNMLVQVKCASSLDELRGLEGSAASVYFNAFDCMILGVKPLFAFGGRNRRPPTDATNALLSFAYSLLATDCASALESVGLDSYVGFMHRDRPGRMSLALDLMEEFRPCIAERFVLTLINNRIVGQEDFAFTESGAVLLNKEGRTKFLRAWQQRKQETITHPYLKEKISRGLAPYVQALLLSRLLRGDLDEYPPFLWK